VAFRNENAFYTPSTEPTRLYRQVLFPSKARLDLAYYPNRTLISDCVWVLRGVLAVAGMHKGLVITMPLLAEQSSTARQAHAIGGTATASRGLQPQI
jgi:hypothetical protein